MGSRLFEPDFVRRMKIGWIGQVMCREREHDLNRRKRPLEPPQPYARQRSQRRRELRTHAHARRARTTGRQGPPDGSLPSNHAGHLGAMDDPYRILRKRTALLDDLPERGKAVWWRMYRSVSDVVLPVRHVPHVMSAHEGPARLLSVV